MYKIYNHIHNDKKKNQKNMMEYDKLNTVFKSNKNSWLLVHRNEVVNEMFGVVGCPWKIFLLSMNGVC